MADESVRTGSVIAKEGLSKGVQKILSGNADLAGMEAAQRAAQEAASRSGKIAKGFGGMNKAMAALNVAQAAGAGTKQLFGLEFDPVGMAVSGVHNAWQNGGRALDPTGDWGEDWRYPIGYNPSDSNQRGEQISRAAKSGLAKAYNKITGENYWDSGAPRYIGDFMADVGGAFTGLTGAVANSITAGGSDVLMAPYLEKAGVDLEAAGIEKDPYSIGKLLDKVWDQNDAPMPVADMPEWNDNMASKNVAIEPNARRTIPDSGVGMREKMAKFDDEQKITQDYNKKFGSNAGGDVAQKMLMQYVDQNQPWRPDFQLPRDHPLVKGLSEEDMSTLEYSTREDIDKGLRTATEMYDYELSQGNPKGIESARKGLENFQRLKNFHRESDRILKSDYEKRRREQLSRKTQKQ